MFDLTSLLNSHYNGEVDGYYWFSDKFAAVEELAELGLATAPALLEELKKAYQNFTHEVPSLPEKYRNHRVLGQRRLKKRLTFRYKSYCAGQEDEWETIGNVFELAFTNKPSDDGESAESTRVVVVARDEGITDEDVDKALHELYTFEGCSHEYDCCGCWSYYVTNVGSADGVLYTVVSHHYKNI